ncbi:hypothetical protein [Oscillatoria sp. HE19RPO]|uniref:hypothetical protein n=1 Tax=Oscillatoria sp. HE19RPO TaxID=2954806 RepID=UPI0020C26B81|nr:hypothetical protein [Oscillatoria sp. HE19RPO]
MLSGNEEMQWTAADLRRETAGDGLIHDGNYNLAIDLGVFIILQFNETAGFLEQDPLQLGSITGVSQ